MWRRLYLTFPDTEHARVVTEELLQTGIKREQMHAMNRDSGKLPGLPETSDEQRNDNIWRWEQLYWNGNLALFALALVGFCVALINGATGWGFVTAGIMATTFLMGNYFASVIPHAHLNEMREPLQHGDVVLMVDLPAGQLLQVDHEVSHRHPEAGGHVVGWVMPGVGRF
jgi:hypothetical protein